MSELSLLDAAQEAPSADCLIRGGERWSYADLAARVRAALSLLRARGLAPGARVALAPKVDLDSIIWLYALFEIGCPAVLIHPKLSERERVIVLEEARPDHWIDERAPGPSSEPGSPRVPVDPDQTLAIVYTSGSRGKPRGACLSRRAFIASAAAHAANLPWQSRDRWLLTMPPAHVGGLSILTRSLIARRCVVLSPGPFDPSATIRILAEHRVTLLSVVPTMLRRLVELETPAWTPRPDLRAVLVGGAPLPDRLRELAASRNVPILATYGCTEACSQIATQNLGQSGLPGSGTPLPGIEVRIEGGEIQVRGDVLMHGYLGEAPGGEPWTSDGWLRTGDFGSFSPDGQLVVAGRMDDLIISGGENVTPGEVEAWLETVPGIRAACVFSRPHEEWGEEVVAALVTDEARYRVEELRQRMRRELAAHKRPNRVCTLSELPMNRSGKVDRALVEARCSTRLRKL